MATAGRTYTALGVGFSTWIELEGDAGIVLTSATNDKPHAFAKNADEAKERFETTRGSQLDQSKADEGAPRVLYTQSFTADNLRKLKLESEAHYGNGRGETRARKTG